jgi:protein-S-isoprenylcysteine O-methyltransferase Ste14
VEDAAQIAFRRRPISNLVIAHRRSLVYLGNVVFALYAGGFAYIMLADFLVNHRASSLLLIVFDGLVAFFAATRDMPKEINVSIRDWIFGFLSFVPLLLRPAPEVHDNLLLLAVQIFGQTVAVAGALSLNSSFGIVAANRGVKTGGLYRFVRHPIYFGFFVLLGSYLVQNLTVRNAVVFGTYIGVQLTRMILEERVLCRDPEYASYARRTRWRVLPFIY